MKKSESSPALPLLPGAVHVWWIVLEEVDLTKLDVAEVLSLQELARGQQYKFELDRQRFFARRVILRELLSRYTGIRSKDITYITHPNGKLSLPSAYPAFNLSASQNRVAVAFTAVDPVGIDLETIRPLEDLQVMLQQSFSTEEIAVFSSLPADLQLESFYHVWTQKEAYLKARGVGLQEEMRTLTVSADPRQPAELLNCAVEDPARWRMVCQTPEPGWMLVVCAKMEDDCQVEFFTLRFTNLFMESNQ